MGTLSIVAAVIIGITEKKNIPKRDIKTINPIPVLKIKNRNRKIVDFMLAKMTSEIDVIIPRGGKGLVKRVQAISKLPIIGHLEGICHTYIDKDADLKMATKVLHNAKLRNTSICGATAIVALAPSINAKKTEITYAIANITVFGLLAMFFYPFIANNIFSNDLSIGLFLGSSIHETAQVAGSGLIYADQYLRQDVVGIAMLTKLVRNTLMVIVIPYLAHRSLSNYNTRPNVSKIFPYFIIGFIVFGLVRTFGDYYFLYQKFQFYL